MSVLTALLFLASGFFLGAATANFLFVKRLKKVEAAARRLVDALRQSRGQ